MLNKISQKIFEKSLDLAIFVNFSGLSQVGRGYHPHPLLANPAFECASYNQVVGLTI